MTELEIQTDQGPVLICETDLPLSEDDLAELGISRNDFEKCFADAKALMEGHTASERVRPCADQTLEGEWFVLLAEYSPLSDPLMAGKDDKQH